MENSDENFSQKNAKELTVVLERTRERAIWVWLISSLIFYLINSLYSQLCSPLTTAVTWTIYSGVLIFWILLPLQKLKVDVHRLFTKKDCQQIYMKACGYKETFTTMGLLIMLSAIFACIVFRW